MWKTLKQIASVGIVTESRPVASEELRLREHLQTKILATLGRALCIRQVDAGSCNGCELEIHALNNAFYNIEGLGIRFVASPRHADLLLVTGPVSRHMELALKRTYDATPDPKLVVAVGDCGATGGVLAQLRERRRGRKCHSRKRRGTRLSTEPEPNPRGNPHRDHAGERRRIALSSAASCCPALIVPGFFECNPP